MVKLEALTKDALLKGIVPGQQVKLVSVDIVGDNARTVICRDDQGGIHERTHYVMQPFGKEPDFGVTAVQYKIGELLALENRS